jgi:hypothetical protein
MRRSTIVILLAALLATSPLIARGCSCGHDFTFHLQSWLDAAAQLRHGVYPRWAFSPAFHAGEPRFTLYPPLSWLLGAALSLALPITAVPAVFTFLALAAAGLAMHRFAGAFVSPDAALLSAALYLANPYMLFNAFERTAYAELLAAAWVPLLLLATLRKRPSAVGIAVSLALLWLTNAPAAVMASYTLALLGACRVLLALRDGRPQGARLKNTSQGGDNTTSPLRLAMVYTGGTALGLALSAFYLVPAAFERRYVQIAMAIIPNMRIEDNFLFGHTADAGHNAVLHTASMLAVTLLAITALALIGASAASIAIQRTKLASPSRDAAATSTVIGKRDLILILATVIAFVALLLTPVSLPIWRALPNLAFLQFSWRLQTILAPVLALAVGLLFEALRRSATNLSSAARQSRLPSLAMLYVAPLCALSLGLLSIHLYRQPCAVDDTPGALAQAFADGHGVLPTDEYTPTAADNDVIRPNEPAYWLTQDPAGFAPNTTPNPGSTDPDFSDGFPASQTISASPPAHFIVRNASATDLVLNLRSYPNWRVTDNHTAAFAIPRDDGLLAIPLAPGVHAIDINYLRTPDQTVGSALSAVAIVCLAWLFRRSRLQAVG